MDPSWSVAEKELAKSLFGRALRLALAEWILARAKVPFFTLEAQSAMTPIGEAASGVTKELSVFVAAGMLQRIEDGRRVYYQPTESALWPAFREVIKALREVHNPDADGPSLRRASTTQP